MFHRGKKELFPIQVYIIITQILMILIKFIESPANKIFTVGSDVAISNSFTIIELTLFYIFLYKRINGKKSRIFLKSIYPVYPIFCLFIWTTYPGSFFKYIPPMWGSEGLMIVIPCLFLIFEILQSNFNIDLKCDSAFIVTCGILFYSGISIPIYFSWSSLFFIIPEFHKIFIFWTTLLYILLTTTFIKAYTCPNPKS
jgi:hypothetical protein